MSFVKVDFMEAAAEAAMESDSGAPKESEGQTVTPVEAGQSEKDPAAEISDPSVEIDGILEPEPEPEPPVEDDQFKDIDEIETAIEKEEEPDGEKGKETFTLSDLGYKRGEEKHAPKSIEEIKSALSAYKDYGKKSEENAEIKRNYEQQLQSLNNQLSYMQMQMQAPRQAQVPAEVPDLFKVTDDMREFQPEQATAYDQANENWRAQVETSRAKDQEIEQMKGYINTQTTNVNVDKLHSEYEDLREEFGMPGKEKPEFHQKMRNLVMSNTWSNQQNYGVDAYGNPLYGIKNSMEAIADVINEYRFDWNKFNFESLMKESQKNGKEVAKQVISWWNKRQADKEKRFKSPGKAAPAPVVEPEEDYVPPSGGSNSWLKNAEDAALKSMK